MQQGPQFCQLLRDREQNLQVNLVQPILSCTECPLPPVQGSAVLDENAIEIQGFIHSSQYIRLGALERWLLTAYAEMQRVEYEQIPPNLKCAWNHHPTIKKFIHETTLDPAITGEKRRWDYVGSSSFNSYIREDSEQARTWYCRARIVGSTEADVKSVLESPAISDRQKTSLESASLICIACAPTSELESPLDAVAGAQTMDVEGFVHSSKQIRLGTLKGWWPEGGTGIFSRTFASVHLGRGQIYTQDD